MKRKPQKLDRSLLFTSTNVLLYEHYWDTYVQACR